MREPMIKGTVVRDFVEWYGERHGQDEVRRLAAKLPADVRAMIDLDRPTLSLDASKWYPMKLASAMFDVLSEGRTPQELDAFLRDFNRDAVQRGVGKSVYRFLLEKLVPSPEMYALCVPRLWRQWHSTGDRRIQIVAPGRAESYVSNWEGHHPALCTMTIETMCSVLELMGCREITWERVSCVSQGARECKTIVRWS